MLIPHAQPYSLSIRIGKGMKPDRSIFDFHAHAELANSRLVKVLETSASGIHVQLTPEHTWPHRKMAIPVMAGSAGLARPVRSLMNLLMG
eukprot:scaffold382063_cov25-Prasinocladus_malaysianus.AAC.2